MSEIGAAPQAAIVARMANDATRSSFIFSRLIHDVSPLRYARGHHPGKSALVVLARARWTTYLLSSSDAFHRLMQLPGFIRNHKLITILVLVVVTPILVFSGWAFVALHTSYSTGRRAGYLQKLSKRGWLCKTWEGELQVNVVPGTAPEVFAFSVRSDSVAAELNKNAGKRVVVTYAQHKGVPTSCFGDTEYYITGVGPVGAP